VAPGREIPTAKPTDKAAARRGRFRPVPAQGSGLHAWIVLPAANLGAEEHGPREYATGDIVWAQVQSTTERLRNITVDDTG